MEIICTLAGAQFRPAESKNILRAASIGDPVILEAEPENEYDPQAVRVMVSGHHVGFIPKSSNGPIFAALMDDEEVIASIVAFESSLKPVIEVVL